MPTFIPNTNAIVLFDNSSDTLIDQSDYISTVSLSVDNQVTGFRTFGLSGTQNSEGEQTWTGNMGVRPATDAAGAHQELIDWLTPATGKPGVRSMRIQEPDAQSGSIQWDMEVYVTTYEPVNQDADGDGSPSIRPAELSVEGVPTLTIIA